MEKRESYVKQIKDKFRLYPICAVLGPSAVGKRTLAEQFAKQHFNGDAHFFDLQKFADRDRLKNPMLALSSVKEQLIVIDEIQKLPSLFPILRVLADQTRGLSGGGMEGKSFLILGSVSKRLLDRSSEALTGRIGYVNLSPFALTEVANSERLWLRGGLPNSYLAESDEDSYEWREDYIDKFLNRDLPSLGFRIPAEQLHRFMIMLAHYHGKVFNASAIGAALKVSGQTAQRYLDILAETFMIRILKPYAATNIKKRQVKSSKVYYRDSGIFNQLTNITTREKLFLYPDIGHFWEGYALEQIIRLFQVKSKDCYFWGVHSSAEIDLIIDRPKEGLMLGFEFKFGDYPEITDSMTKALKYLKLDHIGIIYPGDMIFPLNDEATIVAYGLQSITTGKFQRYFKFPEFLPAFERELYLNEELED